MDLCKKKKAALGTFLFLTCLSLCADNLPASPDHHVLYINSYHIGYTWSDEILQGLKSQLRNTDRQTDLYVEHLDSKRFDIMTQSLSFHQYFKEKYSNLRPNLIVCSDDNALDFVEMYRNELFQNIPLVFCGANYINPKRFKNVPRITGVNEAPAIRETIDLALKLHPETTRLFIVNDDTTTGRNVNRRLQKLEKDYRGKLSFHYIKPISLDYVVKHARELGKRDLLLYSIFIRDNKGGVYQYSDLSKAVSAATQVPVYALWDFNLGDGIVGGKLTGGFFQGNKAGEMAVRILNGTPVEEIPIVMETPTRYMFDFKAMQKHGISVESLPQGSILVNKPYSFYQTNKVLIHAIFFVTIGFSILTLFLGAAVREKRKSEKKYRTLMENIPVAIFRSNPNRSGNLLEVNSAFVHMFGMKDKEEAYSCRADSLYRDSDERNSFMERIINEGEVSGIEVVFKRKDGSLFDGSLSAKCMKSAGGKVDHVDGLIEDISERKYLEEQLRHSQKIESIGRLAGGVAHDFNNMLGGILGASELLAGSLKDNKRLMKFVKIIDEAASRAADLTRQLLSFARKGKWNTKLINTHDLLTGCANLLQRSIDKRIRINLHLKAENPCVQGDDTQLQNAIINICINARDAMPEGGEMTLSTKNRFLDSGTCERSSFHISRGYYVELSVRDTGKGIPNDVRDKIFEPFFTTKEVGKGTGLGLASVYGCVEEHKGAIEIDSVPGKGTEFLLLLPAGMKKQNSAEEKKKPINGSGTVLLVDDEEVVRDVGSEILEDLGYEVISAKDGRDALRIFSKQPDAFDLILLDMIMPEMNGYDTFLEIRKLRHDAKVLIVSGYSKEVDSKKMFQAGASGFIQKPFRKSELSHKIASILAPRGN